MHRMGADEPVDMTYWTDWVGGWSNYSNVAAKIRANKLALLACWLLLQERHQSVFGIADVTIR